MFKPIALTLGLLLGTTTAIAADDFWADRFKEREAEAAKGDAEAQYNLGYMYEKGKGVPADKARAAEFYRKAAEQGVDKAEYKLGVLYASGAGVKKDSKEAITWLRKSADKGYTPAQYQLGKVFAGRGDKGDREEAVRWLTKAQSNGFAAADSELAKVQGAGNASAEAEQKAAAKAEAERLAAMKAEKAAKVAKEKAEAARLAAEKAEAEKVAAKTAATEAAARKAEAERLAAVKAEKAAKAIEAKAAAVAQAAQREAERAAKASTEQAAATSAPVGMDPYQMMLTSAWLDEKQQPAENLPSRLTDCTISEEHQGVLCTSQEQTRAQGEVDIRYQVETVIDLGEAEDGVFYLTARKNVLDVSGTNEQAKARIKLGRQITSHQYDCVMKGDNERMECTRDGVENVAFTKFKMKWGMAK
jgi:hypothetical protein